MKKKNKLEVDPQRILQVLTIGILVAGFVWVKESGSKTSQIFVNTQDSLTDEELKRIVCRDGMTSILKKEPNLDYVPEKFAEQLEEAKFAESGSWRVISTKASLVGNHICRYIARDNKGLRGFTVELFKNSKNPFPMEYKIFGFNEVGARKGEL
jgi:hypothetical protein